MRESHQRIEKKTHTQLIFILIMYFNDTIVCNHLYHCNIPAEYVSFWIFVLRLCSENGSRWAKRGLVAAIQSPQDTERQTDGWTPLLLCALVHLCENPLISSSVPTAPMTLTRGSFSYSSGEEYHGEWKEGKSAERCRLRCFCCTKQMLPS